MRSLADEIRSLADVSHLDDATRIWSDDEAAQILTELLGRPITGRTLSNWRYRRRGPKPEYFDGRTPTYTVAELRRYSREVFQPQAAPRRSSRRGQEHHTTEGERASSQV